MTIGLIVVLFFVIGMLLSAIGYAPRSEEEWQPDTAPVEELPADAQPEPVILTSTPAHDAAESIAA
jgi:hypothetical protein